MKLLDVKARLRTGMYEWGGYPLYFVMGDGEALSFKAARENWRQVVWANLTNLTRSDWYIAGVDINYDDASLFCAHSGERIESAYAEDEANV